MYLPIGHETRMGLKMDNNKLNKLRDIGYTIRKCCKTCVHSNIVDDYGWGTCYLHKYEHKKHIGGGKGSLRDLSITAQGYCDYHELKSIYEQITSHYKEFNE